MIRSLTMTLTLATVLAAGSAVAQTCPAQVKAAEVAIKQTEVMKLPAEAQAMLADARKLVEESKKHLDGKAKIDCANAIWKAKTAQAQAEAAAAISTP